MKRVLGCLIFIFYGLQTALALTITGSACYRFSDNESINTARNNALSMAKQNALERNSVYVRSTSEVENFTLKESIIKSLTAGFIKNLHIIEKVEDLDQRKICRKIQGDIDSVSVEKAINDAIKQFQGENIASKTTVQGLQKIIEKQNEKIESLRKKSQDSHYKKRLIKVINEQKNAIKKLGQKSKSIPYTTRNYDKNLAFLNINSVPSNIDVYINDQWTGKTPIKKYEIEAGIKQKITLRGDPRYFDPLVIYKTYKQFERSFENMELKKGKSKILVLSEFKIRYFLVNGKLYPVRQGEIVIEVNAGLNTIIVKDENGYIKFELETWRNEFIKKNIGLNEYVRKPKEAFEYEDQLEYEKILSKPINDYIVVDQQTRLIWQKGEPGEMKWQKAMDYCNNISLSNYSDWRLPNKDELYTAHKIKSKFPKFVSSSYWSSTDAGGTSNAWGVYFGNGDVNYYGKSVNNYVRCVRGRQ